MKNKKESVFTKRKKKILDRLNFDPMINRANLDYEMATIGAMIFRIGQVKALAEAKMGQAEARIEVTEAQVARKLKRRAANDGDKMTVAELNAKVDSHKDVIAAKELHIQRKYEHNICWAAANAASVKANQLTNISMNYRKELDAGINKRVKEKRAADKVSKHGKRKGR